jgi:phosphoribosylformylglycinamidine synthase
MTAVAKVTDIAGARSSDFKAAGDVLYRLGPAKPGLRGSELELQWRRHGRALPEGATLSRPDWSAALPTYRWLGGGTGREQARLRSLHDISEGGLLVAIAEGMLARGLGAEVDLPSDEEPWATGFGEGFHGFIATVSESDAAVMEAEWTAHGVVFKRLGGTSGTGQLAVHAPGAGDFAVNVEELRAAWKKEGYWE